VILTAALVRNATAYSKLRFLRPPQLTRAKNTRHAVDVAIAKRCDDLVNRYEKDIRQRGKVKYAGQAHRG
jgi:hypothetical protein